MGSGPETGPQTKRGGGRGAVGGVGGGGGGGPLKHLKEGRQWP